MNFDVDPKAMEVINAVWAHPFGAAAKFAFIGGLIVVFIILLIRHKMSPVQALSSLVGVRKFPKNDIFLNFVLCSMAVATFGFLVTAFLLTPK